MTLRKICTVDSHQTPKAAGRLHSALGSVWEDGAMHASLQQRASGNSFHIQQSQAVSVTTEGQTGDLLITVLSL